MLDPHWVFVGAVLGVIGSLRYAYTTARGLTCPNLVTWTLWASAPLIGFGAQINAGVGLPAVMTLAAGIGPLIVVVTALSSRRANIRLVRFDYICAVAALLALAVWLGLGQAPMAVMLAVLADAIAALPTIAKTWRHPDSENPVFYSLVAVGAAITLLTITSWQPHTWAFAAYQIVICTGLVAIIAIRQGGRRCTPVVVG
ncbi:hypothetical protein A5N78_08030 [Prescottella equi]|uniref:hypothetical protein n=1 Tax=Rhodococcus hoagii TaxID=43767 RepID=UPI0007CD7C85|nr:hypothetical protein [Prescottella equi]ORL32474.1 hypothetical protein A6I91_12050 [Prescottella equi]ORL91156.1 hypothetical protein A5N78_08030 [Prescottella equi]ORM23045.1 hypothetical protein A5N70_02495 [Prescottella equi]